MTATAAVACNVCRDDGDDDDGDDDDGDGSGHARRRRRRSRRLRPSPTTFADGGRGPRDVTGSVRLPSMVPPPSPTMVARPHSRSTTGLVCLYSIIIIIMLHRGRQR